MAYLKLTRYPYQKIMIGEDITLTIGAIKNNTVGLCFEAPESVAIDRLEIREQKEARASLEKPHTQQPKASPKKTKPQNKFKLNTIVRVKKSKRFDPNEQLPRFVMS